MGMPDHQSSHAALSSTDIVTHIMLQHATRTRGWGAAFCELREVCKTWRDAASAARVEIAAWHECSWTINIKEAAVSQAVLSSVPDRISGQYDWAIAVYPQLELLAVPDGSELELLWLEDLPEPVGRHVVVGVFLQVPREHELPAGWARRTECVLSVLHPSDPSKSRHRYFRHRFDCSSTEWGYPDHNPSNSFGALAELKASGFVDDDQLHVQARVRVDPGRLFCTADNVVHSMCAVDDLAQYVKTCGPMTFYCDLCGRTLPTAALHRCSAGCNFDVCADCLTSRSEGDPSVTPELRIRMEPSTPDAHSVQGHLIGLASSAMTTASHAGGLWDSMGS